MKQPPKMVSTKDTMYVVDILHMMSTIIKKSGHYEGLIEDSDIKNFNDNVCTELKTQYKSLMEVLNSGK